jgi:putative flippase GtrA
MMGEQTAATRGSLVGQLIRYLVVAVVAAGVDTGSLWLLATRMHVHYLVAAAIAFTLGLLTNFVLARSFVFGRTRMGFWAELSSYTVIGVAGVALTEAVLFLGVDLIGLPLLIAKALALAVVFFWNFFARRFLIYRAGDA